MIFQIFLLLLLLLNFCMSLCSRFYIVKYVSLLFYASGFSLGLEVYPDIGVLS